MSVGVPALLQGHRAGGKDVVGGFLSSTENTLVTAGPAPESQVCPCGQSIYARVDDELHGSLR